MLTVNKDNTRFSLPFSVSKQPYTPPKVTDILSHIKQCKSESVFVLHTVYCGWPQAGPTGCVLVCVTEGDGSVTETA